MVVEKYRRVPSLPTRSKEWSKLLTILIHFISGPRACDFLSATQTRVLSPAGEEVNRTRYSPLDTPPNHGKHFNRDGKRIYITKSDSLNRKFSPPAVPRVLGILNTFHNVNMTICVIVAKLSVQTFMIKVSFSCRSPNL